MKTLVFAIHSLLLFTLSVAEERSVSVFGEGFDIMIDNGSVQFWPHNSGLKEDGGPYFMMIDIALTEKELSDPSQCVSVTQGIQLEIEAPYPISLKLKENKAEVFRVTIFSDACFSGWKRSTLYSINSDGIIALENGRPEKADDAN